ncbi:SDR family oxidoreductase [Vibrio hannami]|uniref:SDR family oxidoreductase n=1 Tax=Vibrio hannami TaxID=2717094 RepID=UPI00240F7A7E|nr:SDR family oxidoreductase [Vibrio hannami]MDG3087459.1 SDR family oxidoreductase [Vibrio hannami]
MSDKHQNPANNEQINRRQALKTAVSGLAGVGALAASGMVSSAFASPSSESDSLQQPLKGKAAIVTGARANMGRAFAQTLAELGANVVIHYHRESTRSEALETAKLVADAGAKYELVTGNLGDLATVKRIFDTAEKRFGGVDIVVNNAGAIIKKPLAEFTDEEFDQLDQVNHRGLFYSLREASRRIREDGRIINIGTSLLAGAAPGYSVYSGTKAAVEEYTRTLAKELGGKNVTVNCIAPGPINTPFFWSQENERSGAYAAKLAPAGRLGEVSDVVPLVRFISSPESQWVNGQTLFINGGYLTR